MKKEKGKKKYVIVSLLIILIVVFMGTANMLNKTLEGKQEILEGRVEEERNLLIASLPSGEGTTYFFRGTHNGLKNNVIWAGHQWKILRVEPDGTVRLLYNGKCTLNADETNCTEGINGGDAGASAALPAGDGYNALVKFNTSTNHNRYVGYMYGEASGIFAEQHANTNNSTIKNRVEAWFNNNANISPAARAQTVPSTFCIDRRIYKDDTTYVGDGLNKEVTSYARGRIHTPANVIPELTCRAEDRLTLNVGLITADEVLLAGLTSTTANNASQTNVNVFVISGATYWTMTPSYFHSGLAMVFNVYSSGYLNGGYYVGDPFGVRPVLSLNSSVTISTGNGSASQPFVVFTKEYGTCEITCSGTTYESYTNQTREECAARLGCSPTYCAVFNGEQLGCGDGSCGADSC